MIRFKKILNQKVMIKKMIILIAYSLLVACNQKEKSDRAEVIAITDSSKIKKDEAVIILNNVQSWVKKGVTKELSSTKVNNEINPLMNKYQNLLRKMNKRDSSEVQNYRIKLINELIDLQIQQNKR
ncbi:hypothetical protein C1637_21630 [Chryseobacterium lactis]|uniref:Lipoprotein n=2 Tax=Chryseobacterium lactis TaxID=1241981 RepID=A0A3G6RNM2_CHRLC|nr:hypothetical protein EG342_16230 [Chryseobacterium lactis]AZB03714.1 hypothetical protein EG341_07105 [Chryseobacterium lactis]PNW11710.1 hypothetical protein C1637_21630 [Chryseobacterium lactis]